MNLCRSVKRVYIQAITGILLVASMQATADDRIRCGAYLIGPGDRMFEVRELCGEPDIKVVLVSAFSVNYGFQPYEEEWQYNFGPQQFMRFLRFRNGRLSSIATGPHGFLRPTGLCKPFELTEGLSTLELLARCGEPELIERRIAEHGYQPGVIGPFYPAGTAVDDWIYDFGNNYFYRIATVIDGRVLNIESNRRRRQ